jgi:hypothetical protein
LSPLIADIFHLLPFVLVDVKFVRGAAIAFAPCWRRSNTRVLWMAGYERILEATGLQSRLAKPLFWDREE